MPLAIAWHLFVSPQLPADMPQVELHTEYVIFSFLINLRSRAERTWNLQAGRNAHQTTELGLRKGVVALDSISTGFSSTDRNPSQLPAPTSTPRHTSTQEERRREGGKTTGTHLCTCGPHLLVRPVLCGAASPERGDPSLAPVASLRCVSC